MAYQYTTTRKENGMKGFLLNFFLRALAMFRVASSVLGYTIKSAVDSMTSPIINIIDLAFTAAFGWVRGAPLWELRDTQSPARMVSITNALFKRLIAAWRREVAKLSSSTAGDHRILTMAVTT